MELEKVTAEIRPRSEWEAVDLGVGLVRAHFNLIFKGWCCTVFPVCLIILLACWNSVGWGVFLIWWLKPIWERVVLYPLSRKLFGETPTLKGTMKVLPAELKANLPLVVMGVILTLIGWRVHRSAEDVDELVGLAFLFWAVVFGLLFYRSTLMRSLVLPVRFLEGLSGAQYKSRTRVLGIRSSGAAVALTFLGIGMECFVFLSQFMFVNLMIPTGTEWSVESLLGDFFLGGVEAVPTWVLFAVGICYVNALSVTAWFYVGGGFGLYLNSRTWTEGWDIELNFKRLGQRLGIVVAAALFVLSAPEVQANEAAGRAEKILRDDDFQVQHREIKIPKEGEDDTTSPGEPLGPGAFAGIGQLLFWMVTICVLVWLIWMIVKNAHSLKGRTSDREEERKVARTVAGMNIAPESLPDDIVGNARRLWEEEKYREALGLLYRGAISSLVNQRIVEIEESDTEMDCLRRVSGVGEPAHSPYFHQLTSAWMQEAYAKRRPEDEVVESLWAHWPFPKGGRG